MLGKCMQQVLFMILTTALSAVYLSHITISYHYTVFSNFFPEQFRMSKNDQIPISG